ncbi:MAG: SGNH/GDSL hydrolase family protein [Verrucomicrobiota bacterium]
MTGHLLSIGLCGIFLSAAGAAEPLPFWENRKVEGDPLFFVQQEAERDDQPAAPAKAALLFTPEAPPVLRSATGEVTYEPGKDFNWEPGSREIRLVEGTRIPFKRSAELYPAPGTPNSYKEARNGKTWMLFGEGRYFHDLQSTASYPTADTWTGAVPAPAPEAQLAGFRSKLIAGQTIKLVTLGDSISTGANASGAVGAPPGQPGYPGLVAQGLEARFGVKVVSKNLSVGGMSTPWGLQQIPAVLAEGPDLLIVAFGMNDASGQTPTADYAARTREIVGRVRGARPACEVIVVATMTANPEWSYAKPELYPAYAEALKGLTGNGCALADVTAVWKAVLEKKSYLSLSGNGLNHPNDFGHRIYADVILGVIARKS